MNLKSQIRMTSRIAILKTGNRPPVFFTSPPCKGPDRTTVSLLPLPSPTRIHSGRPYLRGGRRGYSRSRSFHRSSASFLAEAGRTGPASEHVCRRCGRGRGADDVVRGVDGDVDGRETGRRGDGGGRETRRWRGNGGGRETGRRGDGGGRHGQGPLARAGAAGEVALGVVHLGAVIRPGVLCLLLQKPNAQSNDAHHQAGERGNGRTYPAALISGSLWE